MTAISFSLGALVRTDRPSDPARAVARELRDRGVAVPDDWRALYHADHVDAPQGAAVPEPAHVASALAAAGVDAPSNAARRAVVAAFDPTVETRDGARDALRAAAERGPVGLLANAPTPQFVRRALVRSTLDRDAFDTICSSTACGWRKPHPQAFETLARRLDVSVARVTHVGHADADRGITDAGGRFRDTRETPLDALVDDPGIG